MDYRKEIDGLRSVAVLPVILFHSGFNSFSGGYVGVDIFFVISGYLITTIILKEKERNTFSLLNFYERRARRILPALTFVILSCVPFAYLWMTPNQQHDFYFSIIAVSGFFSNITFWLESGYFGAAAEFKPLLHTWSLAVEEQYYLFFPLLIMALWKIGRKALFIVLLVILFASLAYAQWNSNFDPNSNFYLLPSRLWELLIGSTTAIYLHSKATSFSTGKTLNSVFSQFFSGLGLALILYSIFAFDKSTPFPSLYTLVPTIGAALIILFGTKDTLVAKVLASRALVFIGLISYSAYLWHQPLLAFTRIRIVPEPEPWVMASLAFSSLVLAAISWRFVEQPFRDKRKFSKNQIFKLSATASVFLIGVGLLGMQYSSSKQAEISADKQSTDFDHLMRVNTGLSNSCNGKDLTDKRCRTSDEPEIIVWGDSYAMHLVQGITASHRNAKIVQMTKSVCSPFMGLAIIAKNYPEKWGQGCIEFNNKTADWVRQNKSLRYAVLSAPFSGFLYESMKVMSVNGPIKSTKALAYQQFTATLDFLISQGIQPTVFSPAPSVGTDLGACLVNASMFNKDLSTCDFSYEKHRKRNKRVTEFLTKVDRNYKVVWLDRYLCDENTCKASIDGSFIYRDNAHLSHSGSALLGEKMNFYGLIRSKE